MSEKMKHTPGEWFVDPRDDSRNRCYIRNRSRPNRIGGHLAVARVCSGVGNHEEADARLIAAAPDLLAACEAFMAARGFVSGDGNEVLVMADDYEALTAIVRAAIAKSRGGK